MAEVIKHAIVYDRQLFQQIIQLKPREELSGDMIVKAAEIKTKIVRKDPFEKDIRKILNFGHTIGHAIEALALQKGKPMLHGEAVATGMCFEAMIAHEKQMLSLKTRGEILNCISLHCQTRFEIADEFPQLLALMQNDKKNSSTEIRMALPTRIGKCDYDVSVGVSEIKTVLREFAAAK